ncbi:transcription factor [Raphidocelis subcapitata]|uniref:Transcription factor n=1 Tax=Raphidocelis subcapitata TaxID=307507 RepID=A0A2V0P8C5_9CHLO|nr:transcription factor [Raphidocelis subcapitata]|eukprot:GBF96114.1 transcription factor [Raphidocelis subcapitata]
MAHDPLALGQQAPAPEQPQQREAANGTAAIDGPPPKRARTGDGPDQQQQGQGRDQGDAAAGGEGGEGPRAPSARDYRLKQRRWWALRRRFTDLTAQMEAALCEAKALVAWRTLPRASRPAPLSPQDREVLAAQANRRLYDVAGKACLGVIRTMMTQKYSWPFNHPVDLKRFPDYAQVISQPMDFGTMKDKAEKGAYRDPAAVFADFDRVFANSRRYNPPGSDVYYMATVLQEAMLEQWRKVVIPKLQECAKTSAAEEASMAARKAATARAEDEREMQDAACKLVAALDDLHEQLAAARVDAALLAEPLSPGERAALAEELRALPTAQLEAALGLVLPALAPHLASGPQAAGGACAEVDVDLGRCSALELRQLQSFLGACREAGAKQDTDGADGAAGEGSAAAGAGTPQQPAVVEQGAVEAAAGRRELSSFPAGMLREQTLSEHAGVVWPGVIVGAGLKARNVTLLPGGEPLPPQLGPRGAAAKATHQAGEGAAAGAAVAVAVAGAPSKARRASDTGSAPRPPLPPHRSRLGGQPPTPTQASAGPHGACGHSQSPFASMGGAATAAVAEAAAGAQLQGQLGAHPHLSQLGSAQGSSRALGSGLAGVPMATGSVSGSFAPGGAAADAGRGHGASGVPALTASGGGGLPSTAAVALRAHGESGDEVDDMDAA